MNQLTRLLPALMVIGTLALTSGCKKVDNATGPSAGMAGQETGDASMQGGAPMDQGMSEMDASGKPNNGATNNMQDNQVPMEHPTNATKLKGLESNTVPMDRAEADKLYNNRDASVKGDVPQSVHKN